MYYFGTSPISSLMHLAHTKTNRFYSSNVYSSILSFEVCLCYLFKKFSLRPDDQCFASFLIHEQHKYVPSSQPSIDYDLKMLFSHFTPRNEYFFCQAKRFCFAIVMVLFFSNHIIQNDMLKCTVREFRESHRIIQGTFHAVALAVVTERSITIEKEQQTCINIHTYCASICITL